MAIPDNHVDRPAKEPRSPQEVARWVLDIEARAIASLIPQVDASFDRAVALLEKTRGRVVCTGMGKSGIVMKKIAATLSSTGTPALFLHPAEAIHGDLGMVATGDVVLGASYSGKTEELLRLAELVKRLGVPLIVITGNAESALAKTADLHLRLAIGQEACPLNLAPTASTTATLAMGDALAMALLEARGFTPDDFALLHPGGGLGKRLLKVEDVMHRDDEVPRVVTTTLIRDAIYEMSRGKLGITAVTDREGLLVGCLSDGDLRRLLEKEADLLGRSVGECMKKEPRTIGKTELASSALKLLEDFKITSLFVCDENGRLEGIVHLHDLWRLELF